MIKKPTSMLKGPKPTATKGNVSAGGRSVNYLSKGKKGGVEAPKATPPTAPSPTRRPSFSTATKGNVSAGGRSVNYLSKGKKGGVEAPKATPPTAPSPTRRPIRTTFTRNGL